MSIASDLQAAFGEKYLTVPVKLGGQETRGIYDEKGTLQNIGGAEMSAMTEVVYVQKGTLALENSRGSEILVGPVAGNSAVGGKRYHINDYEPIDDGEIIAIAIAGGSV